MLVTLFATRSVGAEATTGLVATLRRRAVGWTAERGSRHQPPRPAPITGTRLKNRLKCAKAIGGRVARREAVGLSLSLRGATFARSNDNEKGISTTLAAFAKRKRPSGRSIARGLRLSPFGRLFAAPFGASCDESPRVRPKESRCPKRRGAAAFGVGVRASTTALLSSIRAEGLVREKVPTWWLNCRCPSARRGGVGVCSCLARPNDGSAAFPLSALAWCVAFPQRRLRGLPTPAPDLLVPCSSQKLPLLVPSGAGRGLRCVRLR